MGPPTCSRRLNALAAQLRPSPAAATPLARPAGPRPGLAPLARSGWGAELQEAAAEGDNVWNVLANYPTFFAAWLPFAAYFGGADTLSESGLQRPLFLAICRTAWLLKCEYVWRSYVSHGVREGGGFTDADTAALQRCQRAFVDLGSADQFGRNQVERKRAVITIGRKAAPVEQYGVE